MSNDVHSYLRHRERQQTKTIRELRAENERLREALQPFADAVGMHDWIWRQVPSKVDWLRARSVVSDSTPTRKVIDWKITPNPG